MLGLSDRKFAHQTHRSFIMMDHKSLGKGHIGNVIQQPRRVFDNVSVEPAFPARATKYDSVQVDIMTDEVIKFQQKALRPDYTDPKVLLATIRAQH